MSLKPLPSAGLLEKANGLVIPANGSPEVIASPTDDEGALVSFASKSHPLTGGREQGAEVSSLFGRPDLTTAFEPFVDSTSFQT